jgi:2,4-dienoyl-CoA reductase-like NADH-dependent reductase (Old Yellow Enzyme family)
MADLLFQPLQAGALHLPNRIVMAPLTRCRAVDRRIPNPLMVDYYVQRASAGLILAEATAIDPMAVGYANTPGIWNDDQVRGWQAVTRAVHAAGGRIMLQLWHVGRISDPCYLDGRLPVAPSAIAAPGLIRRAAPERPYVTPRALDRSEIPQVVATYRRAAQLAVEAGFDGVEIHGANGYLIDQFLQPSSNQRADDYGGCIENRARFLLEVTDAVIGVWGADRVAMHLAPRGEQDANDPSGLQLFSYVARQLGARSLAFICGREARGPGWLGPQLKAAFGGVYIANQEFTRESAEETLAAGEADAVAFGRWFISNPDLPARLLARAAINPADPDSFYGDGAAGYTDYPALTP